MEFKFNVNEIFKDPIVEINNNLIPPGFKGDRRALWDTVMKVSEVINALGEASAAAQGLTKTITSAERLRNSENQKLYLLVDQRANNGKGAVTGMLKVGRKGLYLFDNDGRYYQVTPPCVLDFYVHESRQRKGLGRQLYEHMLESEQVGPNKLALDKPSEKFLNFLNKYYELNKPIKQMNNYVVFDGFFPENPEEHEPDGRRSASLDKTFSANGLQSSSPAYGRYGPPRPPSCSMGQIIHNQTSAINSSPIGSFPDQLQSQSVPNYFENQSLNPNYQGGANPMNYQLQQSKSLPGTYTQGYTNRNSQLPYQCFETSPTYYQEINRHQPLAYTENHQQYHQTIPEQTDYQPSTSPNNQTLAQNIDPAYRSCQLEQKPNPYQYQNQMLSSNVPHSLTSQSDNLNPTSYNLNPNFVRYDQNRNQEIINMPKEQQHQQPNVIKTQFSPENIQQNLEYMSNLTGEQMYQHSIPKQQISTQDINNLNKPTEGHYNATFPVTMLPISNISNSHFRGEMQNSVMPTNNNSNVTQLSQDDSKVYQNQNPQASLKNQLLETNVLNNQFIKQSSNEDLYQQNAAQVNQSSTSTTSPMIHTQNIPQTPQTISHQINQNLEGHPNQVMTTTDSHIISNQINATTYSSHALHSQNLTQTTNKEFSQIQQNQGAIIDQQFSTNNPHVIHDEATKGYFYSNPSQIQKTPVPLSNVPTMMYGDSMNQAIHINDAQAIPSSEILPNQVNNIEVSKNFHNQNYSQQIQEGASNLYQRQSPSINRQDPRLGQNPEISQKQFNIQGISQNISNQVYPHAVPQDASLYQRQTIQNPVVEQKSVGEAPQIHTTQYWTVDHNLHQEPNTTQTRYPNPPPAQYKTVDNSNENYIPQYIGNQIAPRGNNNNINQGYMRNVYGETSNIRQPTYHPNKEQSQLDSESRTRQVHIPSNINMQQTVSASAFGTKQPESNPGKNISQSLSQPLYPPVQNTRRLYNNGLPETTKQSKTVFDQNQCGDHAMNGKAYGLNRSEVIDNEEEILKDGYPPQRVNDSRLHEENSTTKSERPRSLSLQQSEPEDEGDATNFEADIEDENLGRLEEEIDKVHLDDAKKVNIDTENVLEIEPDDASSVSKASHLTEQGYFDLKFYHNKLW